MTERLATSSPPPLQVKTAAGMAASEGLTLIVISGIIMMRHFLGKDRADAQISGAKVIISSLGTAAFLLILGALVLLCGLTLWRGKTWGRSFIIFFQILLIVFGYSLIKSGQLVAGIVSLLFLVLCLILLFMPVSMRWYTTHTGHTHEAKKNEN